MKRYRVHAIDVCGCGLSFDTFNSSKKAVKEYYKNETFKITAINVSTVSMGTFSCNPLACNYKLTAIK